MPPKGKSKFRKKRIDAKQNKRIKTLEKFVYSTIENKQVNFAQVPIFVSNAVYDANALGLLIDPFLTQGVQDGSTTAASAARVGNSITLMSTTIKFNFDVAATSETYNKFRLLVLTSKDGAQSLSLADVLDNPAANVMSSHYTTKTSTNKRYNKPHIDRVFEVNREHNGSKQISVKIKYGKTGKVINYDGNSAAPTDYKLSILCISDSSVAPHPTMEYTLRHTYKDA